MRFNKFLTLALIATLVFNISTSADARTVQALLDKRGNPVLDSNKNCARTNWLADQCCDPCGFPAPKQPEPVVIEKEKKITYIDLVRQSVYFVIDKDNIDAVDEQRMEEVIAEINKSAGIRNVKLVGYADRFASNKYNIDLSKRRAKNVENYFNSRGYFNNMEVAFGFFGEEKPVTQCPKNISVAEQVACLQADRRVDIEVELLRERIETIKETVNLGAPPAYPRPGTSEVEVYSRPVNPANIQFQSGNVTSTPVQAVPNFGGGNTQPLFRGNNFNQLSVDEPAYQIQNPSSGASQ